MTQTIALAAVALIVGGTVAILALRWQPAISTSPISITRVADESGPRYSESGHDVTRLSDNRIQELARDLTAEEARVILKSGTEPAFCGDLVDNKKDGTYVCRLCSLPLFASDAKFKSGTGWPSFFQPVDEDHIAYKEDRAYGMTRTEILCQRRDGHLGHVFKDGPLPTGLRYCLNSVSLDFYENGQQLPLGANPVKPAVAYFAGGCFWGVEDRFQQIPGVISAVSGYQGGKVENPTYKQVCYTDTGHAESVEVKYDPARISYRELLTWFFKFHNPTQLNRQGPDVGTQYRSAIFPADDNQRQQAIAYIDELQATEKYARRKIVTTVEPTATFYPAEEYHQDYHLKHGGSCAIPELEDN